MQKTVIAFIITASLGVLDVASAAYVIKLKNGNEYVTSRYWQEGTQILFEADRGVFGVQRAFVTEIFKTDRPVRIATAIQDEPSERLGTDTAKDEKTPEKSQPDNREKDETKRDPSDPILKTFADIRGRSQNLDSLLTSEMQQLARDIGSLKKVIQLSGKSNDYLEEFKEIHDIADNVEELLKSRR
jgi:hypothetical protein